jgi:hypothetical protein
VVLVENGPAAHRAFLKEIAREAPARDVIRVASGGRPRDGQGLPASGRDPGTVSVSRFSPDELVAGARVADPSGAWLVYADASYPSWRASIDGIETPVSEANLAFKAVWVPSGEHLVRFSFGNRLGLLASWGLAAFGATYGLALMAGLGLCLAGAPSVAGESRASNPGAVG